MKSKYFYESLIETSDISLELAELKLSPDERVHLISLAKANIHSVVVNTVLANLSEEDKKIFLKNLVSQNHEETWKHLKSKSAAIEEKIKHSIEKLKKELLKDIKRIK